MKAKYSRIFYVRITILLFFLVSSMLVSFFLGNRFGYYLMGDIQDEEKIKQQTTSEDESKDDYSPLVSSRFQYKPDEFPNEEYGSYLSEKPSEDEIVEDSTNVSMSYVDNEQSTDEIFDLGEKSDEETAVDSETADSSSTEKKDGDDLLSSNLIFKVLLGTFDKRENADNLCKQLRGDGYDPYIVAVSEGEKTHYRVQLGAFKSQENANELAEELRKKGYNAWTQFSRNE